MNRIDALRRSYERICSLPWDRNLAGQQRVWIAVYDKEDERRLRRRLDRFREVTERCGHRWSVVDLTDAFADWLCSPAVSDYAEGYFAGPELLGVAVLDDFRTAVAERLTSTLSKAENDENTVVAAIGIASLFGFLRVSEILPILESSIRGRLLIFFPGAYEQNNYRLLDARDGWNYHAVPILPSDAEGRR